MPALCISDGFTLEVEIAGRGPFPPLNIQYRPALESAVDEFLSGPKRGKSLSLHRREFLVKYLVDWDVTDSDMDGAAKTTISLESLSKIPHPYLITAADYVTAYATEGAHETSAKNSATG